MGTFKQRKTTNLKWDLTKQLSTLEPRTDSGLFSSPGSLEVWVSSSPPSSPERAEPTWPSHSRWVSSASSSCQSSASDGSLPCSSPARPRVSPAERTTTSSLSKRKLRILQAWKRLKQHRY